jgi:hypothetical protein
LHAAAFWRSANARDEDFKKNYNWQLVLVVGQGAGNQVALN